MAHVADAFRRIARALSRARLPIATVACVYAASIIVGMAMVHSGSSPALRYGDKLVNDAARHDPAAIENNRGNRLGAAFRDFAGNLVLGSAPKALMGMSVVLPYPFVAYQGWVGGIVSVRGDHTSRLNSGRSAAYYLLTVALQITAYSLAVGSGVNVGVSLFRPRPCYEGKKFARLLPREALLDMLRIYALATPLFLVASLWEFLSPWNT
jgi:hypothetical protein